MHTTHRVSCHAAVTSPRTLLKNFQDKKGIRASIETQSLAFLRDGRRVARRRRRHGGRCIFILRMFFNKFISFVPFHRVILLSSCTGIRSDCNRDCIANKTMRSKCRSFRVGVRPAYKIARSRSLAECDRAFEFAWCAAHSPRTYTYYYRRRERTSKVNRREKRTRLNAVRKYIKIPKKNTVYCGEEKGVAIRRREEIPVPRTGADYITDSDFRARQASVYSSELMEESGG